MRRHRDRQRPGPRVPQRPGAQPLWPARARSRQRATSRPPPWSIPRRKGFTTLADAQAKFAAKGVTKDKHVIAYCGGGISATIDLFLLHQLGYDDITLYDASMGEWARDETLPIEVRISFSTTP